MGVVSEPDWKQQIEQVLLTEEQIRGRVAELAREIAADYQDTFPVVVGVLTGSFVFLADLTRLLDIPVEIDFMDASSYGCSTETSGTVQISRELSIDVKGRDVLLVEDIIDTGITMKHLLEVISALEPTSLQVCSLLSKPARREVEVPVRYIGFEIPDAFVVGYGLDFAAQYRNLPYIAVLKANSYLGRP